jgi:hypothetical protein
MFEPIPSLDYLYCDRQHNTSDVQFIYILHNMIIKIIMHLYFQVIIYNVNTCSTSFDTISFVYFYLFYLFIIIFIIRKFVYIYITFLILIVTL